MNYMSIVNGREPIKFLNHEETHKLIALTQNGDKDALQTLIVTNTPLIKYIIGKLPAYGVDYIDLVQEGCIGLTKAIRAYDLELETPLASFAYSWILSEVHNYITRNRNIVNTLTTKTVRKLANNFSSYVDASGVITSDAKQRIADDFGISLSRVNELLQRIKASSVSIVSDSEYIEGDNVQTMTAMIEDVNSNLEQTFIEHDYEKYRGNALKEAMNILDDRVKDVIKCRYLMESPITLRELSERHSVSTERVRQLEKQGIDKLRKHMSMDDMVA